FGGQFVEQARDSWSLLDHAVGDVERGCPLLARAAQDAQHVVLLQGNATRLDQLGQAALQELRGAEQGQDRLLGRGLKRLVLADFRLQAGALPGHGRLPYRAIDDMSSNTDSEIY